MISSRMQKRLSKLAETTIVKNKANYDNCGVACKWIKIAESWGIKFSDIGFEYIRNIFKNQRRGWRLGIGPFCFGIFSVTIEGFTYYGYITEIALIASKYLMRKFGDGWWQEKYTKTYKPKLNRLKRIIKDKLKVRANDLHEDNWGFINKNLVITDWGFDAIG